MALTTREIPKKEKEKLEWFSALNRADLKKLKQLLKNNFDIHEYDPYGRASLEIVGRNSLSHKLIDFLLENEYNINHKNINGQTCINNPEVVERNETFINICIEKGIDLNSKDGDGDNVLLWALLTRNTKLIDKLIKHKTDINSRDKKGNSYAKLAKEAENIDLFEELYKRYDLLDEKQKNEINKIKLRFIFKKKTKTFS